LGRAIRPRESAQPRPRAHVASSTGSASRKASRFSLEEVHPRDRDVACGISDAETSEVDHAAQAAAGGEQVPGLEERRLTATDEQHVRHALEEGQDDHVHRDGERRELRRVVAGKSLTAKVDPC
jgi:hypothetical protein